MKRKRADVAQQQSRKVQDPVDPPDLQTQPPPQGTKFSGTQTLSSSRSKPVQVRQRCPHCVQLGRRQVDGPGPVQALLVHGLSVERYRVIYNFVLRPAVLAALSSSGNTDYIPQVLELKRLLWMRLSRPQLVEKLMEDGRVDVSEVLDLT